ncbi:late embryogenesis abundant [Fagus crenata]
MTENKQEQEQEQEQVSPNDMKQMRRRRCLMLLGAPLLLLMLLFIIVLILALTVFKPKPPRTQLLSANVEGVAPRLSLPAIQIEFNISLDLELLVDNRNHASFKHGQGKSFLLYQGSSVGEAEIDPGLIPAMGKVTVPCRLTIQVDRLASNFTSLINDVLGGELVVETHTSIPGKINYFGIFRKHVVAVSECQLTMNVLNMSITKQTCKDKTKL